MKMDEPEIACGGLLCAVCASCLACGPTPTQINHATILAAFAPGPL